MFTIRSACFALLIIFALSACANAPETSNSGSVATQAPLTATEVSTATPLPTMASEPTSAPVEFKPLEKEVAQQYTALLFLQSSAVLIEETANQIQAGTLDEFSAFGQLIAASALLKSVDDALNQKTPVNALAPAWDEAKGETGELRSVIGDWMDKKISSADVPALVLPIQENIEQLLTEAETNLGRDYDVDPAELKEMRQQALDQVRSIAQPTAVPTESAQSGSADAVVQDTNKGILFGEPVSFNNGGFTTVGVLVTNTTEQVKSFTIKATYKVGDQIAATASGAINDLLPGQMRAVTLLSQDTIPTSFDTVRVDVDTMIIESATTPGAEVVSKLALGEPAAKANAGFSTVDVEVTNNDTAIHTFTVQAMFLQDDKLVGIGTGAVNDLAPGQTKTATLIVQGSIQDADASVTVDTVIQ